MNTKRIIKSILLALIAAMIPSLASAYDFMVDGLCYNINSDGTTVTVTYEGTGQYGYGYSNLSGILNIPSSVSYNGNYYPVTSIGEKAFCYCSGLTSVNIPSSVTSIDGQAFGDCTNLTSMTIPNSVASIGKQAFYRCSGLTSIEIPSSVTSISEQVFGDCTNLTAVNINDLAAWCNIDFVGADANPLSYAHNLYLNGNLITDLAIPSTVIKLKSCVFCGGSFTSVTIPNSVTEISSSAFYNCTNLTTVTINNNSIVSKEYINNSTEYPIKKMFGSQVKHYIIGDLVTSIGKYAFMLLAWSR